MWKSWLGLFILGVLLAFASPARVQTSDTVWRIAYNTFEPYSVTTEDGTATGFNIEVLRVLAAELGVTLEFTRVDNPGEAIELVRRGEADIVPHLVPTPKRAEVLLFTTAVEAIRFRGFARIDSGITNETTNYDGLRVGFANGAFPSTLTDNFPGAELLGQQDNFALFFALANREIDIALWAETGFLNMANNLGAKNTFRAVTPPLAQRDITFAVSRDLPDVHAALSAQVDAFLGSSEYWAIHARYFGTGEGKWTTEQLLIALGALFIVIGTASAFWVITVERKRAREREDLVARLLTKNEQLQLRDRDMREILYVVSHDLNSPLVSIAGFLGLMRMQFETGDDGPGRTKLLNFAGKIESSIEHMKRLISGLLEIRKIETGRVQIGQCSLDALAENVLDVLAPQIKEAQAEIKVGVLGSACVDKTLVFRAMQNLLENALRHGTGASEPILLYAEHSADGFCLKVRDHGPGIAPENRKGVFELHNRLNKDSKGLGIGLNVVKRVAEAHGGEAWVEATPGGGATFVMSFVKLQPTADMNTQMEAAA